MCKMHLYMPLAECEKGERMVRLLIEFDETLDGILLARCKSESGWLTILS
jgi:hypothetical protein